MRCEGVQSPLLLQFLQNLVNNACKFARKGPVALCVHGQLEAEKPGYHRLRFRVVDDGPGISPAEQVHLLEPFCRSAKTHQLPGVGSGLAMAQRRREVLIWPLRLPAWRASRKVRTGCRRFTRLIWTAIRRAPSWGMLRKII